MITFCSLATGIVHCYKNPNPLISGSSFNMADKMLWHFSKNPLLLVLSLVFLPLSTSLLLLVSLWQAIPSAKRKHGCHTDELATASPKTILVTGINMSKGLAVARMFKRSRHRVIGADWHRLSLGKVSSAIDAYHTVPRPSELSDINLDDPYAEKMLEIVLKEDVDLWISVSDVNSALQDAAVKERVEAESKAKAIQFGVDWTRTLHNKESFMAHTRNLGL